MKKILFFLITSLLFIGCNKSYEDSELPISKIKKSEVFVYSGCKSVSTRANAIWDKTNDIGYDVPNEDGTFDVWYFIRIDGNIPGEPVSNLPSNQYFPQTAGGKTIIDDLNHGKVNANVSWNNSSAKKFPRYIWGTDGSAVQSIIVDEPKLEDLFNADKSTKYDLSGYIEHKNELHFIWYVCKQQSNDHVWHIDGILTSNDKKDISETIYGDEQIKNYGDLIADSGDVNRKAHIEVDIHQQEHMDWNEIKTSIHVRDTVDVEVFLPIGYVELADDFNIRAGIDYDYITEIKDTKFLVKDKEFEFKVSITHEQYGIRINIGKNAEALKYCREVYGDGVTFEVHSYVSNEIPNNVIWDMIKNSQVTTIPYTEKRGQITSAYYKE